MLNLKGMSKDFDFIIVGSGFGGSVSAHRLTSKGYRVGILEQGRRWPASELPKKSWHLRRWLWYPRLGLKGFFSLRIFRHVLVLHGTGVGGGSITYANTLLRASAKAFDKGTWAGLARWSEELLEPYKEAERMLGVCENKILGPSDELLKKTADAFGVGHTFYKTKVGIFQGSADDAPGTPYPDPYFNGEGPDRNTCIGCGGCMMGCQHNAKNTLDKNYLYLAEKRGAKIFEQTKVTDIRELGDDRGYRIATTRGVFHAKKVIIAASALGTMELLFRLKDRGSLPRLSDAIGTQVLTNSESLVGVRVPNSKEDHSKGIAIGSGVFIDEHTHIEATRYTSEANLLSLTTTLLTRGALGKGRVFLWMRTFMIMLLRHPMTLIRLHIPYRWAKEVVIFLCMQASESTLCMRWKRTWLWPFSKTLITEGDRIPTFIPKANEFAMVAAQISGGKALSMATEILFDIPSTAHILGGCPMSDNPQSGVVNSRHEVYGYPGMYICDGSVVSSNLGVNPSLTICALAERAMSFIPEKSLNLK